ncbi:MAG: bifunctional phosphoribosylaminoimidazolecarboxamide formyltransferase/IMP cyclohydrolase [Verrucomicrobia bacterium]|nr:bifunctional phosphoribosylaminoimidazolecarboxamide formyltransferase/IMP cyclohydrolase [Cytophagales bacterium]
MSEKKIQTALISVFYKDNLAPIAELLHNQGVTIYSTGGTQTFLENLGIKPIPIETVTGYPSIFSGRVKTLHPKVFGGILYRRGEANDVKQAQEFEIPAIDLVVVDLYPFEETLGSQGVIQEEIIEKIDIGGISLIRAAAKNFHDVLVISDREQYPELLNLLTLKNGFTDLSDRSKFAAQAFATTAHYDTQIFNFFNHQEAIHAFRQSIKPARKLRYGENPHQEGYFYGNLEAMFEQLNGKELSYNNLVDIDACIGLIDEFETGIPAVAIIKHTNACGVATADTLKNAYLKAFAADTISAFGGVIVVNQQIDMATAEELNKLFFEVLIAPDYEPEALEMLMSRKNRMLLKRKPVVLAKKMFKTLLNGVIEQAKDDHTETTHELKTVTEKSPSDTEKNALLFAIKVCKHTKSNTIILAKDGQLLASGVGQTSRVDALNQAIEKAKHFGFDLKGAVMASDAFFPFPDCVEIAHQAGISAVVQPGGSIKDQDSIDFCNLNRLSMVFTGIRHFKH